ncbi:MAG TPA: hypothetical protein VH482_34975 [Thermomicrobiales bacterium]
MSDGRPAPGGANREFASAAVRWLIDDTSEEEVPRLVTAMSDLVARVAEEPAQRRADLRKLQSQLRKGGDSQIGRSPPDLIRRLREILGWTALVNWARANRGVDDRRILDHINEMAADERDGVLQAAIALSLGRDTERNAAIVEAAIAASVEDRAKEVVEAMAEPNGENPSAVADATAANAGHGAEEDHTMADLGVNFAFDERGLPQALLDKEKDDGGEKGKQLQEKFKTTVAKELHDSFQIPEKPEEGTAEQQIAFAAVVGMLLLDEQFVVTAPGFTGAVKDEYLKYLDKMLTYGGGAPTPLSVVHQQIVDILKRMKQGDPPTIFYQELASVGRFVKQGEREVPYDHPTFPSQVRIADDNYVSAPPIESLALPPLTGDDGVDTEVVPENIHAVALIYAARQLEGLRLFDVVDRITERFMNGQIPVGLDSGGRALDSYYWNADDRMNSGARAMHYARIFNVPGADVSTEVQPNTEFDTLWLRFLSSIVEFDRQQRVGSLFGIRDGSSNGFGAAATGEYVRKAGRDLAANLSLYGYGYSHFAARRLNSHIQEAISILSQPSIQRAYAATTPWQVVERVSLEEWHQAPNIERYRTMAESGKAIMDLIAKYARAWSRVSGLPLFADAAVATGGAIGAIFARAGGAATADIPPADQAELVRHSQNWLAVNGIKDDQVEQYSQPVESVSAPSIPYFGGLSPNGSQNGTASRNGSGANTVDRLRQMVASGQTPTMDQLRELLPSG